MVQKVVQSQGFESAAGGLPYTLLSYNNFTNHSIYFNGTTTYLPNGIELGFVTFGKATTCADPNVSGNWIQSIDVQVPFQDGGYNVTGESVSVGGGPK
ncbi:MAG: hypothetical protein JRM99_09345 [Nitrososphaerota archaeon]|nr:hypothetical protein [Nitrososphaerota archaeon]